MSGFPERMCRTRQRLERVKERLRTKPYPKPRQGTCRCGNIQDPDIPKELLGILEGTLGLVEEWADSQSGLKDVKKENSRPEVQSKERIEMERRATWDEVWASVPSPNYPNKSVTDAGEAPKDEEPNASWVTHQSGSTWIGEHLIENEDDMELTLRVIREVWFQNQQAMENLMAEGENPREEEVKDKVSNDSEDREVLVINWSDDSGLE